jgi:hypothetical protein
LLGQQDVVARMIVNGARAADQSIDVIEGQASVGQRPGDGFQVQLPRGAAGVSPDPCFGHSDNRYILRQRSASLSNVY